MTNITGTTLLANYNCGYSFFVFFLFFFFGLYLFFFDTINVDFCVVLGDSNKWCGKKNSKHQK